MSRRRKVQPRTLRPGEIVLVGAGVVLLLLLAVSSSWSPWGEGPDTPLVGNDTCDLPLETWQGIRLYKAGDEFFINGNVITRVRVGGVDYEIPDCAQERTRQVIGIPKDCVITTGRVRCTGN